jgi:hypothetical protein
MPKLEPIGRVANPEEIEPLTIPIVGYTNEGTEVVTEITFRPEFPAGKFRDLMKTADAEGNIGQGAILDYLDSCVLQADREAWHELLYSEDVNIAQTTVVAVYRDLAEFYAGRNRPTKPSSGRSGGPKRTPRTGKGAA